jgi:hypothetical protein
MYPFFPQEGRLHQYLSLDVVDVGDVDVVAVVVLSLVFFGLCGCPVVFIVGLNVLLSFVILVLFVTL